MMTSAVSASHLLTDFCAEITVLWLRRPKCCPMSFKAARVYLARQPHRQHARGVERLDSPLLLQAVAFQPKHFADGVFDLL